MVGLSLARGRAVAPPGRRAFVNRPRCISRAVAYPPAQIRTIPKADSHHPGDSLMNLGHTN
jgi:hypothetical protein